MWHIFDRYWLPVYTPTLSIMPPTFLVISPTVFSIHLPNPITLEFRGTSSSTCNWISRAHAAIHAHDKNWKPHNCSFQWEESNDVKMKKFRSWRIEIWLAENFDSLKLMDLRGLLHYLLLQTSIIQCATDGFSSFLHRWIPLIESYNFVIFNFYYVHGLLCVLEKCHCMS